MRVAVAALLALLALTVTAAPHGATRPRPPLEQGSRGPRVCDAQWLLAGHRPSVFRGVRPYRKPVGRRWCEFGRATAAATRAAKRELGFPRHAQTPVFGRDLREILTGRRARPVGYLVRAARLKAAEQRRRAAAAANTRAAKAVRIAQRELALGVHEYPDGSNWSPRIAVYQSFTGAYRAPWCASFTQALYAWAGIGTFAGRSAHVFTIVGWARARGYLRAVPRPGDLVAFMDRLGHIGIVERLTGGGFTSIEGNASNRVLRRWHPLANSRPKVYLHLPGLEQRAA